MTKQLKFRVWDVQDKCWLKNTGNPYIFPFDGRTAMKCAGESTGCISKEDYSEFYILEQFTGHKSTFDGDIVSVSDGESAEIGVVKYDDSAACFYIDMLDGTTERLCDVHYTVIGNIHEMSITQSSLTSTRTEI